MADHHAEKTADSADTEIVCVGSYFNITMGYYFMQDKYKINAK